MEITDSEINTEFVGEVFDDDWGQHPGTGDHTESQELLLKGFAPFVERVEAHTGLIGQLLF